MRDVESLSSEEARSFGRYSVLNAAQAEGACPQGSCEAYRDIFTFRRWRAQGYVVRRGERGTKVTTWVTRVRGDEDGREEVVRRPRTAVLFCRHQVERLG